MSCATSVSAVGFEGSERVERVGLWSGLREYACYYEVGNEFEARGCARAYPKGFTKVVYYNSTFFEVSREEDLVRFLEIKGLRGFFTVEVKIDMEDSSGRFQGMSNEEAKAFFRSESLRLHPDKGGSAEDFVCMRSEFENHKTDVRFSRMGKEEYLDWAFFYLKTWLLIEVVKVILVNLLWWLGFKMLWSVLKQINPVEPTTGDGKRLNDVIRTEVVGGANRWSKVQNAGCGGKSKAPKPPQAPAAGIAAAKAAADKLEQDDEPEILKRALNCFVVADKPKCQTLFRNHLDSIKHDGSTFAYDCLGAPICGVACVDTARGVSTDLKKMVLFADGEDIYKICGSSEGLRDYCLASGVNLAIYDHVRQGDEFGCIYAVENNPNFRWVRLMYLPPFYSLVHSNYVIFHDNAAESAFNAANVAKLAAGGEAEVAPGHYVLICGNTSKESGYVVSSMPCWRFTDRNWLFGAFFWGLGGYVLASVVRSVSRKYAVYTNIVTASISLFCYYFDVESGFKVEEVYMERNDDDNRCLADKREKLAVQDEYCVVSKQFVLHSKIGLGPLNIGEFARECLPSWLMRHLGLRKFVVSVVKFVHIRREAEALVATGRDHRLAFTSINKFREVNTNINRSGIDIDTIELVDELSKMLVRGSRVANTVGLVAKNAPNDEALVQRLDVIRNVQLYGGDNSVSRFKLRDCKRGVDVAVCPIGCFESDVGPLGPGLFSVTDSVGILVGFCGRSMQKDLRDRSWSRLMDFVGFSVNLCHKMLNGCDFTGEEPDCVEFFREHYKGKKTAVYIENVVRVYEKFREGRLTPKEEKQFRSHGAFVKFESNIKVVGEKVKPRPRLIFTMSDLCLIEGCPILNLIDKWNDGPFGQYQIKHLEPSRMVELVEFVTDRQHNVSDYSSFESSLDIIIRAIENFVLTEMCLRGGYLRTLNRVKELFGKRTLTIKGSGELTVSTRCSGDFWTSFGNCLVNGLIMLYLAKVKGFEPLIQPILCEGDDGIMPKELVNLPVLAEMGFSMSQDTAGTECGDTDFLRSRWVDGKRFLCVGRCLSAVWVKQAAGLKKSKQLFLLRCIGASLHSLSPGHPVLFELVNKIGELTRSTNKFKNFENYLDSWKGIVDGSNSYPREVKVDETMRSVVANGCIGFPSISVAEQLELEERIRNWDGGCYIGRLLSDYEDVEHRRMIAEGKVNHTRHNIVELVEALNDEEVVVKDLRSLK